MSAPIRLVAAAAALALLAACGGGGGGGPTEPTGGGTGGPDPVDDSPLASTGTIAYARGGELRLVEPDGTGDRPVWTAPAIPGQPDLSYRVTAPAWRPDGGELAFSSDHERAFSPYATDVYAVRPDGKALRKLTNGPTRARHASFPKGAVTVSVTNQTFDFGPFVILVLGGEPISDTIAAGATKTYTFPEVADLGPGLQPVVAVLGAFRHIGGAGADVRAGQTVDAGVLVLSGAVEGFGARDPFWRSDASRVGFVTEPCIVESIPARPPPGWAFDPLVAPEAFLHTCGAEWGPTAATADQLLLTDTAAGDGTVAILRVQQGASAKPTPVTRVGGFHAPDLHWLPDGSGFRVVAQPDILAPMQIHEFLFGTGELTPMTALDLGGDTVRRFSVSPDGRRIVFERTDELFELISDRTDLWIADRDGSNARLLVTGGTHPAWNPTRP